MYAFMGWLNIALVVIMTAPFWLRIVNDKIIHLKSEPFRKILKLLRKIHKPLGGGIVALSLIHGYLALGSFRLHTGTLLWLSLFVTAALGILFYSSKKRALFLWHKRMVVVVLLFLFIHLFFPAAIYYLLHA